MKDSLKNKLKTEYESSSEIVPSKLWERIEAELDENKSEIKSPLFNYKWGSLAAVFLLFISLGFIYYFNSNDKIEKTKNTNLTAKIIKTNSKNSTEKIIQNSNINRLEPASEKIDKKAEMKIAEVSGKKSLNKLSTTNNIVERKSSDSQIISKDLITEKPSITIAQKEIKENVKYTSAKDLLFGYELEKTNSEMQKSHSKLGVSEIKKPKEITILGIKVYSDENSN